MRAFDPEIDTVERWGEEQYAHIVSTGIVDDWKGPLPNEHHKSMLKTIGQQGVEIEELMTERNDLKSENDQLRISERRARWLIALFGSAVLLLLIGMMI